jgi:hypothetical protein
MELKAGNAPCTRFQDQEQISVSLARRSHAVSPLRFGSGHFSRTPDKKSRRLAGAARLISVSRETAEGLRRIGRLRFMFGAVVLSFGLLALAMLNLLRAPLDRCLASSRLFSVCCRFVRTLLYCKDDRAVVRLIAIKLDSGNAITFRKEL